MFKDNESYTKPTAEILVIDIDEACMITLESSEIGSGEGDGNPDWDFEE